MKTFLIGADFCCSGTKLITESMSCHTDIEKKLKTPLTGAQQSKTNGVADYEETCIGSLLNLLLWCCKFNVRSLKFWQNAAWKHLLKLVFYSEKFMQL